MSCYYTIGQYLKGKVRNINVPDEALQAVLADLELTPCSEFADIPLRERELALANFYVWIASSPTTSGKTTDKDADWEHSEGGESFSVYALNRFLRMANEIYAKYNMPKVSNNNWGMIGLGFSNIRASRPEERNL